MENWLKILFCLVTIVNWIESVSVDQDLSMTLSQKNALDAFRDQVKDLLTRDHMKTDIYLIRWLRAKDFNLKSAEAMLRENLRWRKEKKMDTILEEDWTDIIKDYHATIDTHDREARPIGVIDIYDWDIRRAVLQGKGQRLLRYMDYLMENITMQVFDQQAAGLNVTQWKVLGNAEGFNLIEHGCPICIPLWIQFVQSLEGHYTGWLDELIVIEAPPTIQVVLQAIRPFLSRNTQNAMKIFGLNRAKWMPYMEQRIDKSERRPQYGGTKPLKPRR